MAAAQARRMEVVQQAYETFCAKWDPDLPHRYDELPSLHLFDMARRHADRVQLMETLPAEASAALEFH